MTQAAILNREAVTALANRRLAEARDLLSQALALDAKHLPAWINLAIARRMEGDLAGAMQALDQARVVEPLHFPALLMRGSLYEAMDKPRHAAMAYNIALTQMLPSDVTDNATRRAIEHARSYVDAYKREMESFLVQRSEVEHLSGASAPVRRMQGFLDGVLGHRQVFHSSPTNFFYPGLPSIEIFDRDEFHWLAELEALTPDIQAELANVLDDEVEPYVQRPDTEPIEQWGELNRSKRWSAYHFANHGDLQDAHLPSALCCQTYGLNQPMGYQYSIRCAKVYVDSPDCLIAVFVRFRNDDNAQQVSASVHPEMQGLTGRNRNDIDDLRGIGYGFTIDRRNQISLPQPGPHSRTTLDHVGNLGPCQRLQSQGRHEIAFDVLLGERIECNCGAATYTSGALIFEKEGFPVQSGTHYVETQFRPSADCLPVDCR